jgi:predicted ATPase/DNA-binding SARP family transcriptional activator
MAGGTWFGVLGPLELRRGGETVVLPSGRQRSLLALLLLYAGEPLSRDRLIQELWGDAPPSSAVSALHVHISKLRRLLGDLLIRVPAGYVLAREEIDLDVWRFDALVDGARADPRAAAASLREALSLCRGEPLCDVECEGSVADWRRLLEERRLQARLSRFDAELAEGAAGELIGELERLAGEHPLEERLVGHLMLALYRGGRQADALSAYERLRSRLDGELGLQPGEPLRVLQVAILNQDPSLVAAWPAERDPRTEDPAVPDELEGAARFDLARGAGGSSLPELATPTFGRADAVEEVVGLLRRGDVRLVTLTGPGGVGKTRLALLAAHAAAGEFADGAWWVELAGLPRDGDVAAAVVRTLGVMPTGPETSEQALLRELAGRQLLLVLDNFEHVIERATLVAVLHRGCPRLTVLVTSREGLDLAPEHRFVVWPLAVPAIDRLVTAEAVTAASASAMFLAAAGRRDHGFVLQASDAPAVARICTRLEGLPLSLELAAARTTALSLQELADALEDQLEALGPGARDAPPRQRTLQATIEWSYGLLEPALQRVFVRFAVFAGGATSAAAIAVTGAAREELEALVAKSLIVRRLPAGGGTRLVMLEAVRHHAQRLLAADLAAQEEVCRRHVEHYLRLVQSAAGRLSTREEPVALAELDSETENLRAARAWALVHDPPRGLRLTGELALYWSIRGEPMALDWLDEAIAATGQDVPLPERALATLGRARALSVLQDRAFAERRAGPVSAGRRRCRDREHADLPRPRDRHAHRRALPAAADRPGSDRAGPPQRRPAAARPGAERTRRGHDRRGAIARGGARRRRVDRARRRPGPGEAL